MEKNEYYKMYQFENDYWWYQGLHALVEHYVKKEYQAAGQKPLRIFDGGCGTGRLMEILAKYGRVDGVDYSVDAVKLCKERGLDQVEQGDLNVWEGEPNAYDIIVSNDVVCTSGVEDDLEVMKKFYKALKPGGTMILNHPAFMCLRRDHDIAVFGKRRYRKWKTINDLKELGFKVTKANYRLPALFFLIVLQKYVLGLFKKNQPATSDLKPIPEFVNHSLLLMHRMENGLFKAGLPFFVGSSLFLVCKK